MSAESDAAIKRGLYWGKWPTETLQINYRTFDQAWSIACNGFEVKLCDRMHEYAVLYAFRFRLNLNQDEFYKVGVSRRPLERLRAIQTQMPPVFSSVLYKAADLGSKSACRHKEFVLLCSAARSGRWLHSEWIY